jgi:hypothetical protein
MAATPTAASMAQLIGRRVYLPMDSGPRSFQVLCTVTDAKYSYGCARVQLSPVTGTGAAWFDLARVKVADTQEVTPCNR